MNENEWKILFSDILVVAVLGASISLISSFVQFGAWFFTLGLFFGCPTLYMVIKRAIIFALVGAVIGIISGIFSVKDARNHVADESDKKVWMRDSEMVIYYKELPPNFREISENGDFLAVCGFCKYYDRDNDTGCSKYGVKGYGVGCLAKTVCDDFQMSL